MPGKNIRHLCHYAHWKNLNNLVIESDALGWRISGQNPSLEHQEWSLAPRQQSALLEDLRQIFDLAGDKIKANQYHKIRHKDGHWVFNLSTFKNGDHHKIIIDFINKKIIPRRLSALGMDKASLKTLNKALKHTSGLILVSSPSNQGLSTTIYSMLQHLNQANKSIYSLETYLESPLKGVNQIRLKTPFNSNTKRSLEQLLRHDTDIIAIDEINHDALLKDALKAAASRIIIAGIRADRAATAVKRLKASADNAHLLREHVNIVINQRLAALNCPRCVKKNTLSREEAKQLLAKYPSLEGHLPKHYFKSDGCPHCQKTSERRLIGLFEIISPDYKHTLPADALLKLKNGLISVEEMLKL